MNTILFSQRHELTPGKFVMHFNCPDIKGIDTELFAHYRSELDNKRLRDVRERITLSLQNKGFKVESVNFSSMSITAIKK